MDNEKVEYLEEKTKRRLTIFYDMMSRWTDKQNKINENINRRLERVEIINESRGTYDKDLLEGGCQNYPIGEKKPKKP